MLTVDPARRLAQSMGLTSLDNTPRLVDGVDDEAGGSLHAMMLDMKRTFDEIVEAHADPARAAQILANPFYQSLSSSFAGTQEYMAMEKLGQLRRSNEWDLIVVDTPPSRSALDFLDAPERLGRFLDGRLIRVLTAPVKASRPFGRVLNAGFSVMTGRADEAARRAGAARRADVHHGVRHDVRRLPRARGGHLPAAAGAGHVVPGDRRRPSRTRCARRRTSSSGSPRSGCRSPG